MAVIRDMVSLLPILRQHLDTLEERFMSFAQHGVQTEGWLKGEMLMLLDRLRTHN